jgi:hypothetical protein
MPEAAALAETGRGFLRPAGVVALFLGRMAGAVMSFVLLGLALRLAFQVNAGPPFVDRLQALLFGRLAWVAAVGSAGWALVMFRHIVQAYRKRLGFPWFPSLSFSSSAFSCLMALHACLI